MVTSFTERQNEEVEAKTNGLNEISAEERENIEMVALLVTWNEKLSMYCIC
jgi:hypothetical protein